jgi:hypothetical protein
MTSPSAPAATRVAVGLRWPLRAAAAFGAASALAYGAALGWRAEANGVATAAAFAVGFLFATFALSGVVPSTIKVGDVEVQLDRARESGKQAGHVDGLAAGAAISRQVAAGDLPVERVEAALRAALTGPGPLRVDGIHLPVPHVATAEAEDAVRQVGEALATVVKYSAR